MPKRTDISSILVIGAGPIVIGQACEFDYSGTQAIKALTEEGYRIVLVNSNPATIMTDPELADATYVEPITPAVVAKIIEKNKDVGPHPGSDGPWAVPKRVKLLALLTFAGISVAKREQMQVHARNGQRIRTSLLNRPGFRHR